VGGTYRRLQDLAYHNFADQRGMFGIPHFWNVISMFPLPHHEKLPVAAGD
jgi:hypothetical protein